MAYWGKKELPPALELDLVLFSNFFFSKLFKHIEKLKEENMNTLDP